MIDRPILIVEDNPDDEVLMMRALEMNHIKNDIVVARDGIEALDLLLADGTSDGTTKLNPLLVLLDIKLPKLDGLQVLERIRSNPQTRRLPVIILTTSDEESDIARSYDLGVNSYVRKPLHFAEFSEAVSQLGLYWLLLNEPPPSTQ